MFSLDNNESHTIAEYYEDVCNQLNLTPKTLQFLNSDIEIDKNPFVNNETLRFVLQEIEKVACSFSEIDTDTNEIDLVWLSDNENPDYEFTTEDYSVLEGGKVTYGPVNTLVLKYSQIEGENVTMEDSESIAEYGVNELDIEDSYFLFTQELKEQAIENIWDRVKGLTYTDCKITTYYGKPFLKVGQKIRVNTNEGNTFDTYVLKHTFTYDGTFQSVIESPVLTKQETKIKNTSVTEAIRQTEIRVDKAEGTINATTMKVLEVQDTLNNEYYKKTLVNDLIQDAETGVTNTFSEAGGNNILRNTGLWFKDDKIRNINIYNNEYVFCNYDDLAVQMTLNNVYPITQQTTGYIRNESPVEVNSAYQYSVYIANNQLGINYKIQLLELNSSGILQTLSGEIIKHQLDLGSNQIELQNTTTSILILLEKNEVSRNIEVGDDLSDQTVYSTIPLGFHTTVSATSESGNVITSANDAISLYNRKGDVEVGINYRQDIDTYFYSYLSDFPNDEFTQNLTIPDDFGVVTSIDNQSIVYPYLFIGNPNYLTIADVESAFEESSISPVVNDDRYEYWTGKIKRGRNDNSVSYSSILLQNGTVFQEQDVPNGNYSLSFYYKKLVPNCTASVIINDTEYIFDTNEDFKMFYTGEQDSETGEYIVQPITVNSKQIKVAFTCNVNNGVEIYDLMCNKGTVKLAYSQNQNETTTTTVNISKGITITSTDTETIFKANADGIRLYATNDIVNPKTKFTDKGMETEEAIIKSKEQTCGTLIQEVSGQTWFTRM